MIALEYQYLILTCFIAFMAASIQFIFLKNPDEPIGERAWITFASFCITGAIEFYFIFFDKLAIGWCVFWAGTLGLFFVTVIKLALSEGSSKKSLTEFANFVWDIIQFVQERRKNKNDGTTN